MSDIVSRASALVQREDLRLAVDAGGSTVRIVEVTLDGERITERRYRDPGKHFADLTEAIATFLLETGHRPKSAAIGAAGPVEHNERVKFTNVVEWEQFDVLTASSALGMQLNLFNDLVIAAASIETFGTDQLQCIRNGSTEGDGPKLVTTLSTGVNDALVLPRRYGLLRYLGQESGHVALAPRSEVEIELVRWAMGNISRYISFEDAISGGSGLPRIYGFVTQVLDIQPLSATAQRISEAAQSAPVISSAAVEGDPACVKTLQLAGAITGTYIGGRAATTLATGGVYLIGSMSLDKPMIDFYVNNTEFLQRFADQGRNAHVMREIPIYRVLEKDPGLTGAIELARHL